MQTMGLVTAVARYDLTHLSDGALLAGARRLVGTSNQLFADLLAHLAEVEARGIHRTCACASLYTYCIYELRFSEDAAFRRVSAARLVKSFPAIFDAIAAGELHLTGLLMIGPHLTQSNHLQVLARAKHRTKRELATLIRQIDPHPDVPSRIEPLGPPIDTFPKSLRKPTWEQSMTALNPIRELAPGERPRDWIDESSLAIVDAEAATATATATEAATNAATEAATNAATAPELLSWPIQGPQRYAVHFTATEEYATLVERAKALLSHSSQGCSLAELHLKALRAFVEQLEKRKYGARKNGSAVRTQASTPPITTQRAHATDKRPRQHGRYIPAEIRQEVYRRDGSRCTYVDSAGTRCAEVSRLELHHRQPFATGGTHTADNLTLHCRAHNSLCAEQAFAREQLDLARSAQRHESLRLQLEP